MKKPVDRRKLVKWIVIFALLLVFGALFAVGLQYGLRAGSNEAAEEDPVDQQLEPEAEVVVPDEPPEEEVISVHTCPLDGLPSDPELTTRRPLAVVVDNNSLARPQDGLDQACLVYEVPVEGGQTRFIAVYLHEDVSLIGPVRSARDYMIDVAQAHDAVLCHCGGSPAAYLVFGRPDVHNLDDLKGAGRFWRVEHRRPPHNLYARTSLLWEDVDTRGMSMDEAAAGGGLVFGEFISGSSASVISVRFGSGNRVTYRYEDIRGTYLRFIGDTAHRDARSAVQLEAVNVVVQFITAALIPGDTEGRLAVTLAGSGRAIVASGGTAVEGQWSRQTGSRVTRFVNADGDDIELAPGQTWILLVPTYCEVTVTE